MSPLIIQAIDMGHCRQKGITLIELVVYLGVLGIFFGFVTPFIIRTMDVRGRTDVYREAEAQARFVLERLSFELRQADGIDEGASVFGTDQGVLTLSDGGSSVVYRWNDESGYGAVRRVAGSNQLLTSDDVDITSLRFTNITHNIGSGSSYPFIDSVRIEITAETNTASTRPDDTAVVSVQTAVSIRDHREGN